MPTFWKELITRLSRQSRQSSNLGISSQKGSYLGIFLGIWGYPQTNLGISVLSWENGNDHCKLLNYMFIFKSLKINCIAARRKIRNLKLLF